MKRFFNKTTTSVGRFYEKRQQFDGALDQYSKALSVNPKDTGSYIDRSRVFLKMGSIVKAQQDTDVALNLIGDQMSKSSLLSYYVCLQKAQVLYADGEFEFALMYFHRANKIKAGQPACLDGIRQVNEILQCTIGNRNLQLTITNNNNSIPLRNSSKEKLNLLNRPAIRKGTGDVESPLTKFTHRQANRLLSEVSKDRQLLLHVVNDQQILPGFNGLNKAKIEARQAISVIESQLKYLSQAECLHSTPSIDRLHTQCPTDLRMIEDELKNLQNLPAQEKSMEILYRATKLLHCLKSSADPRTHLFLAETTRLIARSYDEIHFYDQSSDFYRQTYEILLPFNDSHCLSRARFDYARSLMLKKNFHHAIELFVSILDETNVDQERAIVCQYLSESYFHLNELEQAKTSAYRALDFASSAKEDLLIIEINLLLGKIFVQFKDFPRAKEYFLSAQNLQDQLGSLEQIFLIDQYLQEIDKCQLNLVHRPMRSMNKFDQQWISAMMRENENETNSPSMSLESSELLSQGSQWRLLTPYSRLFEHCLHDRRRKTRPVKTTSPDVTRF